MSGFGFPVVSGSELIGVLEFFSRGRRERDEDRHIYEKLQVHSKSEAVSKALRNRLV